jgi:SPP1 gp7 family putative phage head morphogenesis protein
MSNLPPQQPGRVQRVIEDYRRQVMAQDAAQMTVLARRWLVVERGLEAQLEALAREAADLRAKGTPVTAQRLYQMERYRNLLAQARSETLKYQKWAAELITGEQRDLARLGIESSRAMIRESYLEAGKAVARFNWLPVEAVESMIGYAGNGAPLYDLLIESYPDTIEELTKTLIRSTAQGINPRQTAKAMAEAMSGNLQRSLVIARTEQLRAFRNAATIQMRESGVVEGWIWRSAKQDRTCLACLAMDGTVYDLNEELDDHPNGRCFKQPLIQGLKPIETQSSADWFNGLDEETQQSMMGEVRYEAWKQGQFRFEDLAIRRSSEEWGSHVAVAPLEALLP